MAHIMKETFMRIIGFKRNIITAFLPNKKPRIIEDVLLPFVSKYGRSDFTFEILEHLSPCKCILLARTNKTMLKWILTFLQVKFQRNKMQEEKKELCETWINQAYNEIRATHNIKMLKTMLWMTGSRALLCGFIVAELISYNRYYNTILYSPIATELVGWNGKKTSQWK